MNILSRDSLGFSYRALPLVVVIGLALTMASAPQALSESVPDSAPSWASSLVQLLGEVATTIAQVLSSPLVAEYLDTVVLMAIAAGACLVPAAAIRSARAASWRPLLATSAALVAGLLALPALMWVAVALWYAILAGQWVVGVATRIGEWLADLLAPLLPALGWLLLAAVATGGLWVAARSLLRASTRTRLMLVAAGVGSAAAVNAGWVSAALQWFSSLFDVIAAWLATWIPVALGWLVTAFIVCAIAGAAVALLGSVGRTTILTLGSAWDACRDQRRSSDLAAGVGLMLGVMLVAAATQTGDGAFGPWLTELVESTTWTHWVTPLIGVTQALIPTAVEPYVTSFLSSYSVAVEAVLLLTVAAIGILSLALRPHAWAPHERGSHRVLQPSMIAAGVAVALAIPLALVTLWALLVSDDS